MLTAGHATAMATGVVSHGTLSLSLSGREAGLAGQDCSGHTLTAPAKPEVVTGCPCPVPARPEVTPSLSPVYPKDTVTHNCQALPGTPHPTRGCPARHLAHHESSRCQPQNGKASSLSQQRAGTQGRYLGTKPLWHQQAQLRCRAKEQPRAGWVPTTSLRLHLPSLSVTELSLCGSGGRFHPWTGTQRYQDTQVTPPARLWPCPCHQRSPLSSTFWASLMAACSCWRRNIRTHTTSRQCVSTCGKERAVRAHADPETPGGRPGRHGPVHGQQCQPGPRGTSGDTVHLRTHGGHTALPNRPERGHVPRTGAPGSACPSRTHLGAQGLLVARASPPHPVSSLRLGPAVPSPAKEHGPAGGRVVTVWRLPGAAQCGCIRQDMETVPTWGGPRPCWSRGALRGDVGDTRGQRRRGRRVLGKPGPTPDPPSDPTRRALTAAAAGGTGSP